MSTICLAKISFSNFSSLKSIKHTPSQRKFIHYNLSLLAEFCVVIYKSTSYLIITNERAQRQQNRQKSNSENTENSFY